MVLISLRPSSSKMDKADIALNLLKDISRNGVLSKRFPHVHVRDFEWPPISHDLNPGYFSY
jgi:hypothetical protein